MKFLSTLILPFFLISPVLPNQICDHQQTVFKGNLGVIYELLPSSSQQSIINNFVENILLNSDFYALGTDSLTGGNRTLVTAIPYPSTESYNVQEFGAVRSQGEFSEEVDKFNRVVAPLKKTSDISDALLYVLSAFPDVSGPSVLIIIGNSKAMLDNTAPILAEHLQKSYTIFTVAIGPNPVDLSGLSSGPAYSYTGSSQSIADQIALQIARLNPSIYCPFGYTTAAPFFTTTIIPPDCTFYGNIAVVFELNAVQPEVQIVVKFVRDFLFNTPGYDFSGPTKEINLPYGYTDSYSPEIMQFGDAKTWYDIKANVDLLSNNAVLSTDPKISDALSYLYLNGNTPQGPKAIIVVGYHNDSNPGETAQWLDQLRPDYHVLSVAVGNGHGDLSALADKPEWYFSLESTTGSFYTAARQISTILCNLKG